MRTENLFAALLLLVAPAVSVAQDASSPLGGRGNLTPLSIRVRGV